MLKLLLVYLVIQWWPYNEQDVMDNYYYIDPIYEYSLEEDEDTNAEKYRERYIDRREI